MIYVRLPDGEEYSAFQTPLGYIMISVNRLKTKWLRLFANVIE